MRMNVVCLVAIGFAASASSADEPKSKAIAEALKGFTGTWEIASSQPAGITKDARKLVFRRDLTYAALDKDGKELWAGTFEIDPTASPKVWDHRSNEARKTGGDALGIYKLDGEKLTVSCVVGAWKEKQWVGKPRPKEFQLPAADAVLELRRQR